jgi:predicted O-methyltransferase YrrM
MPMNLVKTLRRKLSYNQPLALPFQARHVEHSAIASADDDLGQPTDHLIEVALKAADHARRISMAGAVSRMKQAPYYPNVWPGEHYKLLAGLVQETQPKQVIEIGTSTGLSALAMLEHLPGDAVLHTFDVIPWEKFGDTCLASADFASGQLKQIIDDVSIASAMQRHAELFGRADLIFVDGPKDGLFERRFLELLVEVKLPKKPLLVFDDIRVWNMLALWRSIARPKLDMTSLGHWSGTGFVHWVG